jgi:N-acetyl-gamma-glutamyl-phosphate reductase
MIDCGILGATGYAGAELARILLGHPGLGRLLLASSSAAGGLVEEAWPNLAGACRRRAASAPQAASAACVPAGLGAEPRFLTADEVLEGSEVVFSALPHGHGEALAAACAARGTLFIDLSADFRFGADEATYRRWYGGTWKEAELHAASVWGLPELNRSRIRGSRIIGNPGCYPTAASLGLIPLLESGLARREGIVIDAASGLTGAGKEPTRASHYAECADSLTPYKIGEHRHIPEIAAALEAAAGAPVSFCFTPHLAPMGRGIVATIYVPLAVTPAGAAGGSAALDALRELYLRRYAEEPFVRVLPPGLVATNRNVRFSNYCDLSVHLSHDGKTAIIVSAIDNMVKGAAGQAVQNMNIALGLEEGTGISALPPAF